MLDWSTIVVGIWEGNCLYFVAADVALLARRNFALNSLEPSQVVFGSRVHRKWCTAEARLGMWPLNLQSAEGKSKLHTKLLTSPVGENGNQKDTVREKSASSAFLLLLEIWKCHPVVKQYLCWSLKSSLTWSDFCCSSGPLKDTDLLPGFITGLKDIDCWLFMVIGFWVRLCVGKLARWRGEVKLKSPSLVELESDAVTMQGLARLS